MNAEENTPYYDSKFVIRSLSVYPIIKVVFYFRILRTIGMIEFPISGKFHNIIYFLKNPLLFYIYIQYIEKYNILFSNKIVLAESKIFL